MLLCHMIAGGMEVSVRERAHAHTNTHTHSTLLFIIIHSAVSVPFVSHCFRWISRYKIEFCTGKNNPKKVRGLFVAYVADVYTDTHDCGRLRTGLFESYYVLGWPSLLLPLLSDLGASWLLVCNVISTVDTSHPKLRTAPIKHSWWRWGGLEGTANHDTDWGTQQSGGINEACRWRLSQPIVALSELLSCWQAFDKLLVINHARDR